MENIRPVETEADYDWALREVSRYFEHEPALGTPDAARFSVLLVLIGHYESRHWRIEAPDPVSVIKYFIDQKIHTQSELAEVFGSRSRASEVLGRKRPLTLDMVRALGKSWKLPADVLVQAYPLDDEVRPAKKKGRRLGEHSSMAKAIKERKKPRTSGTAAPRMTKAVGRSGSRSG